MITIKIGDCRNLIKELPDNYIDCVMTSPPYWGLRDYGHPDQIGLEKKPEEYLNKLLNFFDDVKLKLKDAGNVFVNLGDSYMSGGGASRHKGYSDPKYPNGRTGEFIEPTAFKHPTIQPKSLCMIPQRFAWGMIEHGWILRNEIIWAKPNHMPESVTDRLTKAHEVIYHFVKQGKYYYNLDAIRRQHTSTGGHTATRKITKSISFGKTSCFNGIGATTYHENGANPGDVWMVNTQPYPESHFAVFPLELVRKPILAGCPINGMVLDPFGGSGTVGEFCRHNDRNAILFELNPEYKKLIEERTMIKIKELTIFE